MSYLHTVGLETMRTPRSLYVSRCFHLHHSLTLGWVHVQDDITLPWCTLKLWRLLEPARPVNCFYLRTISISSPCSTSHTCTVIQLCVRHTSFWTHPQIWKILFFEAFRHHSSHSHIPLRELIIFQAVRWKTTMLNYCDGWLFSPINNADNNYAYLFHCLFITQLQSF